MIEQRGANRDAAIDDCGRRRGDARFLQRDGDVGIDVGGVIATVAEAHNVQRYGREQFQHGFGLDALLQILRERATAGDDLAEFVGAISLDCEPGLERAETA